MGTSGGAGGGDFPWIPLKPGPAPTSNDIPDDGKIVAFQPFLQQRQRRACKHRHCSIDPFAADLSCNECGAQVDPWTYLRFLAQHESEWAAHIENAKARVRAIEDHIATAVANAEKRMADLQTKISALVTEKNRLENLHIGDVRVGTSIYRRRTRKA